MPDWADVDHVELVCPNCGYSLRGLQHGELITCPECGHDHDMESILAASRARREMSALRWLLLQFAPVLVFLGLSAVTLMLLRGARGEDVVMVLAHVIVVLSVPWCGMLCWNAFKSPWLAGRVFITVLGTAAYIIMNVMAALVLFVVLGVIFRAF